LKKIILSGIFIIITIWGQAQIEKSNMPQNDGVYKDRITDDSGNPIAGVKIQVQGTGVYTYSDYNGNFSIRAKIGDFIVLSKNGERISSYRLDGSSDYYLDDERFSSKSKKKSRSIDYLDSARVYVKKDPFKSLDFVEKKLTSKKNLSNEELYKSYHLLGESYFNLKQYDLSVSNFTKALNYKYMPETQLKLAKAEHLNKEHANSLNSYNKLKNQSHNEYFLLEAEEGIGQNYEQKGQFKKALEAYRKALTQAENLEMNAKIASLNTKIAQLLTRMGDKKQSQSYLQNTLQKSQAEPIQERIQAQNKVADIYQANESYDEEIALRKKTIQEIESVQNEPTHSKVPENQIEEISISELNLDIGRAYMDKKEYDKAIPYLEKSAEDAKKTKDLELEKNAIQKLSELYKNVGNSQKALEKYQEYAGLVDQLYQQKEAEITQAITLSNELRDKQNRINSLEKDRALSESQYELAQSQYEINTLNTKKQKILIYSLIGGMMLLGAMVWFMFRSNKQEKLNNNLLALKSLRTQMNPHFIFNALNSVNNFIAKNDERAANRYLTDFSTLMRSVLNNSERDFIPLSEEIELLKLYVQLEHSRFTDKFDYQWIIDENLHEDTFEIPPMLIQPYVENAVWHGLRYKEEKGLLKIEFGQAQPDEVHITITDNGIGRTKSQELKTEHQKKQVSKAMQNIKKRIQILNDMYADKVQVKISDLNKDGTGTQVHITLKA
jgi:tetratricopeptide (TPR) repeat protein